MKFNPKNALMLVADDPETLRAIDVPRLRGDCGRNWASMKSWLLSQELSSDRTRNAIESEA